MGRLKKKGPLKTLSIKPRNMWGKTAITVGQGLGNSSDRTAWEKLERNKTRKKNALSKSDAEGLLD